MSNKQNDIPQAVRAIAEKNGMTNVEAVRRTKKGTVYCQVYNGNKGDTPAAPTGIPPCIYFDGKTASIHFGVDSLNLIYG